MSTTPKLDAAIAYHSHWPSQADELQAEAFKEIREHIQRWSPAKPEPATSELQQDIERPRAEIKAKQLPPHPLLRLDGYPSEAETRLIELMQAILDQIDFTQGKVHADVLETWKGLFAIIKRDLGLV